jgi:hypothetical protein
MRQRAIIAVVTLAVATLAVAAASVLSSCEGFWIGSYAASVQGAGVNEYYRGAINVSELFDDGAAYVGMVVEPGALWFVTTRAIARYDAETLEKEFETSVGFSESDGYTLTIVEDILRYQRSHVSDLSIGYDTTSPLLGARVFRIFYGDGAGTWAVLTLSLDGTTASFFVMPMAPSDLVSGLPLIAPGGQALTTGTNQVSNASNNISGWTFSDHQLLWSLAKTEWNAAGDLVWSAVDDSVSYASSGGVLSLQADLCSRDEALAGNAPQEHNFVKTFSFAPGPYGDRFGGQASLRYLERDNAWTAWRSVAVVKEQDRSFLLLSRFDGSTSQFTFYREIDAVACPDWIFVLDDADRYGDGSRSVIRYSWSD